MKTLWPYAQDNWHSRRGIQEGAFKKGHSRRGIQEGVSALMREGRGLLAGQDDVAPSNTRYDGLGHCRKIPVRSYHSCMAWMHMGVGGEFASPSRTPTVIVTVDCLALASSWARTQRPNSDSRRCVELTSSRSRSHRRMRSRSQQQ